MTLPAKLRIVDPCAPRAYADAVSLHRLGGTEATVLSVANALCEDFDVCVEQAARVVSQCVGGVKFSKMDLENTTGGTIIVINVWDAALICRRHNPDARIFVWQHVVPDKPVQTSLAELAEADIGIVCVSDMLAKMVRGWSGGEKLKISVIANPVSDDLHPDTTQRDPDLLFFASSPHKGLDQVVSAFVTLRADFPELRLEVADPGYLVQDNGKMPENVTLLGTLHHDVVIEKMRRALCVFYPQTSFAETFGLVIAEANAVGCPVLIHRGLGANDEVASDASQCIDGADPRMIAARIGEWRKTPPYVTLKPRFRHAAVVQDWHRFMAARSLSSRPEMSEMPVS